MKPRLDIHFTFQQQKAYLFGKPYVPKENEFLLNHSRSAILLALRAADLPDGAGIGVMVYNCHTVMNAVKQAGFEPVFIDVDDDLRIDKGDLKRKSSQLSALIVTHLFGIVNDVCAIKKEFPQLVIIEDCAHAYGIDRLYGDFATFSVGQGKLPSIGDGGVLTVLNGNYLERTTSLYDDLKVYSVFQSISLFFKLFLISLLYRSWLYGWATLPLKQRRTSTDGKEDFSPKKMCNGISAVFDIEKNKLARQVDERQRNANEILRQLNSADVQKSYLGCNAFMLVVYCDNPERLREKLYREGVDSATHFSNSIYWASGFGYRHGECPNAEKLITRLLMIPIY